MTSISRTPTAIKDKNAKNKTISCLGAYGGPVDPNTILGGFPRKNFVTCAIDFICLYRY